MHSKSAVKTVSFIFITILAAKLLGQAREMVMAYIYGISPAASAYVIASQLPLTFFDMILGSAISSAFIPVYNMYMEEQGRVRADRFASGFLKAVLLLSSVLCIIGVIFSHQIVSAIAPKMGTEEIKLAGLLLQIMFPMVVFIGLAFTLVGILQSLGEFKIPAAMSVVSSLVCILYLFTLNGTFGIQGLAFALLIGWMLQFVILVPPLKSKHFHFCMQSSIKDEGIRKVAILALPILFSTWVQPINATVNIMVASSLHGGQAVAAVNYANKLYIIAASVFAVSLTNYIFPGLSRLAMSGEREGWERTVSGSIKAVLLGAVLIALMFMTLSSEMVSIIYQRGAFDSRAASLTSTAMFFYSVGMVGFALQEVLNKAFYSKQNAKTPMIIAIGTVALNVPLSFLLARLMGVGGLALAASLSALIWCVISFVLTVKGGPGIMKGMGSFLLRLLPVAAVSILAVLGTKYFMGSLFMPDTFLYKLIKLMLPALVGTVVYGAGAWMAKIEEITWFKNLIKHS